MSNADVIRRMDDDDLADFLNQWAKTPWAWKQDPGETLYWLQKDNKREE